MRKKLILIPILLIIIALFCGCLMQDESQSEASAGKISDFYGTWTDRSGKGSFSLGNSIRFKDDKTCDFFWENDTMVLATGIWEITVNSSGDHILTIRLGEKETNYSFSFLDSFKSLKLRQQGSKGYIYYNKK
jgi:hypothetical protein